MRTPAIAAAALLLSSCGEGPDLVLYCALDQEHAEPLVRRFAEETGLDVRAEFDVEASKTVGLVTRIRQESRRPRCDVFWNNEVAHTVALANEGLLEPYGSPSASDVPALFRDPENHWTGFAARARIYIVNTELADPSEIRTTWDLLDPRWAGKVGMARPLTGTTLTHVAALYSVLGEERAEEYVRGILRANRAGELSLTSGNATLMRQVADGVLAFGWTDTDDFNVALERGAPVAAVWPDQEPAEEGGEPLGAMLIPNTIAIVAGAPHPEVARRFVDWVLRPEVERELAFGRSAQIPVRASVERPEGMPVVGEGGVELMDVDYLEIGRELPERQAMLKEVFLD